MPTVSQLRSMMIAPLYGGDAAFVVPTNEDRAVYNEVINMFSDAGDDLSITTSTLRSEVILGTTLSFEFSIRADQPSPTMAGVRTSENRLDINDAFTVGSMSLGFGNELIASVRPGDLVVQYWPNPAAVAAGTGAGGFAAAGALALMQAYNSRLDWTVNAVRYIKAMDTLRFKYIDTAQGGIAPATGDSAYRNREVWFPLTPCITMAGSDEVLIRVNVPDSTNFSPTALNRTVAVLQLRGIRIQNGGVNLKRRSLR